MLHVLWQKNRLRFFLERPIKESETNIVIILLWDRSVLWRDFRTHLFIPFYFFFPILVFTNILARLQRFTLVLLVFFSILCHSVFGLTERKKNQ